MVEWAIWQWTIFGFALWIGLLILRAIFLRICSGHTISRRRSIENRSISSGSTDKPKEAGKELESSNKDA